jgi:ribonucleoside-diphosphate reductase alpha chain
VKKREYYNLYNPRRGVVTDKLSANEFFYKIVSIRHGKTANRAGIVFIDKMNRKNPTPATGLIESVNLCGEQSLLPYESCNLGPINLGHFIKNNDVNW